jgi:hypothetical protein
VKTPSELAADLVTAIVGIVDAKVRAAVEARLTPERVRATYLATAPKREKVIALARERGISRITAARWARMGLIPTASQQNGRGDWFADREAFEAFVEGSTFSRLSSLRRARARRRQLHAVA